MFPNIAKKLLRGVYVTFKALKNAFISLNQQFTNCWFKTTLYDGLRYLNFDIGKGELGGKHGVV